MRVGFVTQLLFERFGGFWRGLVSGAGATVVVPTREGVVTHGRAIDLDAVPGLWFQLAAAQAASLSDCDLVVVPELNPESQSARGSAQDRWVADLAGALVDAVPGLPTLVRVAAYPDAGIESRAVSLLNDLLHDPGAVSRVWSRQRAEAAKLHGAARARPRRGVGERGTLPPMALVGQPWAVTDAVTTAAIGRGLTGVSQRSLDSERARAEGWSFDERLLPTDAEVIGAARILSRRAGVTGLRFLCDDRALSDAWLLRRVTQAVHKPVEPLTWSEVASAEEAGGVFLNVPVD